MTIEELKEGIEQMGMKEHANPTKEYEELRYMVGKLDETQNERIVDELYAMLNEVHGYYAAVWHLEDLVEKNKSWATWTAWQLWKNGWGCDDYYYFIGDDVYPFSIYAVDRLKERLLEAIEKGGER